MARIGFSTLGCPDWTIETVLAAAERWGADCIEIRFLGGRIVGPEMGTGEIDRIARLLAASPVGAETLATSVKLAGDDDLAGSLMPLLDMANQWRCRRVRVFMSAMPADSDWMETFARRIPAVRDVLDRALRLGLEVALETHDVVATAHAAAAAAARVGHPGLGIVWDTVHTVRSGEPIAASWAAIGAMTREVQVKDARILPDGGFVPALLDAGDVPWRDAVAAAGGPDFDGAYMLEWEKAWHPEIAGPEVAIPHDLARLREALGP